MSLQESHLSQVNASRLTALEKRMNGMDGDIKELERIVNKTREEISALKTEMRIWGAVLAAGIAGMIGLMFYIMRLVLEHMINTGQIP